MSFNVIELAKVAKPVQVITFFTENYRYKIQIKTDTKYYRNCVRKCGVTIVTKPETNQDTKPIGVHSKYDDTVQIQYENTRQQVLLKILIRISATF